MDSTTSHYHFSLGSMTSISSQRLFCYLLSLFLLADTFPGIGIKALAHPHPHPHRSSQHHRHGSRHRGPRVEHEDFVMARGDDDSLEGGEKRLLSEILRPEDIDNIRISYVKQKMMDKLHMDAPPNVTSFSTAGLPAPLLEEMHRQADYDRFYSDQPRHYAREHFYSKTTQNIIMAKPVPDAPKKTSAGTFLLDLPMDVMGNTVSRAYLTIRKRSDVSDNDHNQTLVLYELRQNPDGSIPPQTGKSLKHHMSITTNVKDGWFNIDITSTIRHWAINPIDGPDQRRVLQVVCKSCSNTSSPIYLTEEGQSTPFLTIDYKHRDLERRRRPRDKRSHRRNSCDGDNCCLRPLEVTMDPWVLQPTTFYANYCDGSCSINVITDHGPAKLRESLLRQIELANKVIHLCCVPVESDSLKVLYHDREGVIRTTTIPDMVARTCGCK